MSDWQIVDGDSAEARCRWADENQPEEPDQLSLQVEGL